MRKCRSDSQQLRHMILSLLFPDRFRAGFRPLRPSQAHSSVPVRRSKQTRAMSALEISKAIQEIRAEQESKYGKKEFDFYWPPLKEIWKPPNGNGGGTEKSRRHSIGGVGCRARSRNSGIEYFDTDGFPPDAASSTYDLIHVSGHIRRSTCFQRR